MKFADEPTASKRLKSMALKVWMEGGTIAGTAFAGEGKVNGEQRIEVTPKSLNELNTILKKDDEYMNGFDVIFIGTWDCNRRQLAENNPSSTVIEKLKAYINSGKGVIVGHDVVHAGNHCGASNYDPISKEFLGIDIGYEDDPRRPSNSGLWVRSTQVKLLSEGQITNFPNDIGTKGTILSIPSSHTLNQVAMGETLIRFNTALTRPDNESFFLAQYKHNTAMIQTGHSNCESTIQERQIIANAIFALTSTRTETKAIDNNAWDLDGPEKPQITVTRYYNSKTAVFNVNVEDKPTLYNYRVKNVYRSSSSYSNIETASVKRGIEKIYYHIDDSPNTIITEEMLPRLGYEEGNGVNQKITLSLEKTEKKYVHFAAVDKAGNLGGTNHADVHYPSNQFTTEYHILDETVKKILILPVLLLTSLSIE
jgi:hypothetical protein